MRDNPKEEALDFVLGLKKSRNQHTDKIKKKISQPPPSDKDVLEKVWAQMSAEISNQEIDKAPAKILQWFTLPRLSMVASLAAICLIVVFLFYPRSENQMIISSNKGEKSRVDITTGFDSKSNESVQANFENVEMVFRQVKDFKGGIDKQTIVLGLSKGQALFEYAPLEGRRGVTIKTPHATFSIVGTKFLLNITATETELLVAEGRVQVNQTGFESIATQGMFYSSSKKKMQLLDLSQVKTIISAFSNSPLIFERELSILRKGKTTPGIQKISVELTTGQIFTGILIKEDSTSISIKYQADLPVVKVEKSKIRKMVKL